MIVTITINERDKCNKTALARALIVMFTYGWEWFISLHAVMAHIWNAVDDKTKHQAAMRAIIVKFTM